MLDEDVDAAVAGMLRGRGHEAWPFTKTKLTGAPDDDVTVYADYRRAVLVTMDNEFSRRRKRNTVGQHVHLRCADPDALTVLERHLDDLVPILLHRDDVMVELSHAKLTIFSNWD